MDRSVARANRQQTPAAIHLAVNFILANFAFGRDRKVEIDVSIARMKIDIGGKVSGDFE
jgi:hypothetical protein